MMDPTSLVFLIVMVLVGGAIAGFGDWLGRKIGKKRRSFFFLRPKHTAIAVTVLAGMVGTFLAIAFLFGVSDQVRVWILRGTQLQGDISRLQQEMTSQQNQLEDAKKATDEARTDLTEERAKLETAEGQVERMRADARQLTAQAKTLRSQSDSLRKDVASFRTRLDAAAKNLKEQQARIDKLTRDADELNANASRLTAINRQLQDQNLDLTNTRRELENTLKSLNEDVARLTADAKAAEEEKVLAEAQRDEVEKNLASARTDLRNVQTLLTDTDNRLRALRSQLDETLVAARFNQLIFGVGEEIVRRNVPSPSSVGQARQIILAAISEAVAIAEDRGAQPRPGELNAAGLITLEDFDGSRVTAEMQLNAAANTMTTMNSDVLLLVKSYFNAFAQERTALRLEVIPNSVVIRANQVLGELRVEPGQPRDVIVARIDSFVRDTVRQAAIEAGLVVGPQGLGEVSTASLLDALDILTGAPRAARVQFVAGRDTRRGDALIIELRIR
ncbi:MAG: DUF3084 domain-containing protein [Fimbriimonadaceae bacterium]|nr:DUF3084 domain-containing protein [Fimbriimonadaceae bacterium]